MKKMSVNDIRDFIHETYHKQIGFSKEDRLSFIETIGKNDLLMFATKLIEKVPDPHNAKQHYESFLRKKNRKLVKQSELLINQKLSKPKHC